MEKRPVPKKTYLILKLYKIYLIDLLSKVQKELNKHSRYK